MGELGIGTKQLPVPAEVCRWWTCWRFGRQASVAFYAGSCSCMASLPSADLGSGHHAACGGEGSLRFGEFAGLVQAHADDLRSRRTMKDLLAIDRALKLRAYTRVENIEPGWWRFRARSSSDSGSRC